jgi:hypothetical protein
VGFLDSLVFFVLAVVFVCLIGDRLWAALALMLVGTLAHEMILVIACPIVVFAILARHGLNLKKLGGLLATVGICVALVMAAPPASPEFYQRFVEAGMQPHEASYSLSTVFSQSLASAATDMAGRWNEHTANGVMAAIYSLLPALAMFGLPLISPFSPAYRNSLWRASGRFMRPLKVLTYCGASFAPVLLLGLAWDLSRMLQFTNLSAFICSSLFMLTRPPHQQG